MPRFNSQTLIAAKSRAFVRAMVPGAARAGSASLPLSDSAELFGFGLGLRRAARCAVALVGSRMSRGESSEGISAFESTAQIRALGAQLSFVNRETIVTAAASNRVRDFMWVGRSSRRDIQ